MEIFNFTQKLENSASEAHIFTLNCKIGYPEIDPYLYAKFGIGAPELFNFIKKLCTISKAMAPEPHVFTINCKIGAPEIYIITLNLELGAPELCIFTLQLENGAPEPHIF